MNITQLSAPGADAKAVNVRLTEPSARKAGLGVGQLSYQLAHRESSDRNGDRCRLACPAESSLCVSEQLPVTNGGASGISAAPGRS